MKKSGMGVKRGKDFGVTSKELYQCWDPFHFILDPDPEFGCFFCYPPCPYPDTLHEAVLDRDPVVRNETDPTTFF